jgi:apolipoprotein N-acyltransferase
MSYSSNNINIKSKQDFAIILLASILNGLSFIYVNVAWAILALPLIIYLLLKYNNKKQALYIGALFGGISCLFIDYWMIAVVTNYAKGSIFLGIICYLTSAFVMTLCFGLQFYSFMLLRFSNNVKISWILNALLFAAIWIFFEWTRSELFSAMPWLSYIVGVTEARWLFMIQPAALGGIFLLSFILLFSSYLIADAFYKKNWRRIFIPAGLFTLQFVVGYFIYSSFNKKLEAISKNQFSVALILPGLSPETVWNDNSADTLVAHLFSLNNEAVKERPQLIVWTETVVPWTYMPEDDFVKEIVKKTNPANAYTLIGINSAFDSSGKILCNSAYLLDPEGKNIGRYDKQDLLTFVEKPLLSQQGNLILPFLDSYDLKMRMGENKKPVETPWGKAGVVLCNESTYPTLSKKLADNGATFLVNMGNDNWFAGNYVTEQHFYNGRLRAVENRKDIIMNNNMGVCGVINASGEILVRSKNTKSGILCTKITPNKLPGQNSSAILCFMAFIILIGVLNKIIPLKFLNNKL